MTNIQSRHIPELDIVRSVAFIWVFLYHAIHLPNLQIALPFDYSFEVMLRAAAFVFLQSGRFGVDLFFTLSAFLITTLLLAEHSAYGRIKVGQFYMRRILRIWPLYFAVAALVFGAVWVLDEAALKPFFWPYMFMVPNWGWAALGSQTLKYPLSAIWVYWSLGIEEQFYLFWPAFLRWVNVENTRKAAWGMLACSVLTRLALEPFNLRHPWVYANTFARLDPIAMGILLSTEWVALQGAASPHSLKARFHESSLSLVAGVMCFLGGGLISSFFGLNNPTFLRYGYPLVALGCYLMVFHTLQNIRPIGPRGPLFRAMAFLGKISYGLYVFHGFILGIASNLVLRATHGTASGTAKGYLLMLGVAIGTFGLTVLASHLSYTYFESPFLRLKKQFTPLNEAVGEVR